MEPGMTIYEERWFEEWPNPIPEGWIYAGTDDEFGILDRFMVPIKPAAKITVYSDTEWVNQWSPMRPRHDMPEGHYLLIEDNDA